MTFAVPRLGDRLRRILQLNDPPWRIALAFAVGVFIGCTPFWFFQTVLALLIAALFRLPTVAAVTGVWLNLPWFAPFVYAAALHVGAAVVGAGHVSAETLRMLLAAPDVVAWADAKTLAREMSIALIVGTTVVGLAAGGVAFVIVYLIARRRRPSHPSSGAQRAA